MPAMYEGQTPKLDERCKGFITVDHVKAAVEKLAAMDMVQKEKLADDIVREQPALFTSFVVQRQFGVSLEKMEFLLEILFVCFLAMKETALSWPKITEDDVDACMTRYVKSVEFGKDMTADQRHDLVLQFVEQHPEQALLAYVQVEVANWLKRIDPEDSDRFVVLAATNMVNCIAYTRGN